ncbi:helicase-exonuclease AddAB subunit AddB [Clostridium scatologenes]|uniref:ATP-dependent helicase/deoxyribonuclease subunit B n=1 Tax=Clostridium scatologenes TaxID=1548 RepID=A0A0E3JQ48_CLOSL|nr:helicase-exonuclease AddAB subunit AddB [Clostridium scatologenes]AKA70723.1 ATP-dependent nuclease subunit B [Clostridium scatologenes]
MSLRFIYGRAGSGKSHFCLNDIKKKINEGADNPLILLVPEQFSFQAEKNLIKIIGEAGMLKAQVLSFRRMAYKVLNEVGGLTRKHINASGKSMLIYKIMEENSSKLKVFKKSVKRQGFITTVSDIITEFKRYDITLENLNSTLDRIENENLRNKMEDLILIFSQFEERLHKKYVDSEDDLTILAEKMSKSHMFDEAEIWIDEFSSFTPQEYKVLDRLMDKTKRINITLCTDYLDCSLVDNSTDVFLPTKSTEEKILKIVLEKNIKYDKPIALKCSPCYRFKDTKELQHLEKYLFSYPYKVYKEKCEDISIFKALNKYTEVEDTARDIVRMCRDSGFRFKDIAVISGDLDGYESLFSAIFKEYDIPYFIDKKRKINDNPIIMLIMSVVEILSQNWSYESVFRYLKTGLLELNKEDIDLVENYVLSSGIKGSAWVKEEPWDFGLSYSFEKKETSDYEKETLNNINLIRDKIREPIIKLYQDIKGRKKGRDICEGIYNFLCNIKLDEKVAAWIEYFKENEELDKANEYSQIWNIVMEVLDQIVEVMGEETLSVGTFSQVLSKGFDEYEIGVIPPALDQVLIGSVTRLKSHDVSVLYIVGVNDGVFPAALAQEGVLTDSDRELLKERGIEIAKDTRSRAFEEQFLVYTTLTTVSKYLRLSYSIADEVGKTKRPSIVIGRIKKIFSNVEEEGNLIEISDDEEKLKYVTGPRSTFNKLISNIKKDSNGYITPMWLDVYRWYNKNDKWNRKLENVFNGFSYSNEAEIMDTNRVRKLYGRHLNISVSRLERFVNCPFSYFIQYGLNAKERKVYKLSSPDLGSFMHNVLQVFSSKLKEEKLSWKEIDSEWCEKEVSEIVDEILESMPSSVFNSSKRYKHITNNAKRILNRSVWLIAEHMKRGGFEPSGYELSFGNSGDFPPISLQLHSGETISLIGRVDRVDSMSSEENTYLRIVDYKSGTKEFKLSDVYYGLQMQLLIYLDAMLTELEKEMNKEAIPGGILYFKLDDPIVKTKGDITDSEIEERIMKALKMNGLLLDDPDIIRGMDNEIEKNSDIIPASIKKDGTLSKAYSSVATIEQFNLLRKYVRDTIASLCEQILEGNICVKPSKHKNGNACEYCIYPSICQFDTSLEENKYKIINDKSDETVWNEIKNKYKK